MLTLDNRSFQSHLLVGTARYPSLECLSHVIQAAQTNIITVSLKRETQQTAEHALLPFFRQTGCQLLPNTAGCRTAKQAIAAALMARELFNTSWVKLEVIADDFLLHPDPFALIEAARELVQQGFFVLPYCTDDLVVCEKLVNVGCRVLMPWAAPIGSGQGLLNPFALSQVRRQFPDITLIVDAGIGQPSQACAAMELGYDGVLLNSAIAEAADPIAMARAFAHATEAGYLAYRAGLMPRRALAQASTALADTPFWLQDTENA